MQCVICKGEIEKRYTASGEMYWDSGNNALPVADGRCCDKCDCLVVIPARMGGGERAKRLGEALWIGRVESISEREIWSEEEE